MQIVLATDGREAADGATRMAAILEAEAGGTVEVICVIEPVPIYGGSAADMIAYTRRDLQEVGVDVIRERVRERLAGLVPGAGWSINVEVGPVAATVADYVTDRNASLAVLGLGRHERLDRWFGTETALHVARLGTVPVLAVPGTVSARPRRAVIAMDFSDYSHVAAREAASVCASDATLHLAHVLWEPETESPWMAGGDWPERQRPAVTTQIEEMARSLAGQTGHRYEVHVAKGDPGKELLALAERLEADLIAAGSHGAGFINRLLVGSVSTRLLRGASCSVLVVPPKSR
jgi:nucleotide-binding universal stress UspA family protein